MVCHDGAFATEYHGYSTDELFFVRLGLTFPIVLFLTHTCGQFNYEWGGRPWEPRAKEVIKK